MAGDPAAAGGCSVLPERNVVERTIAWLKQHRAIAIRFDKLAVNYHIPHLAGVGRLLPWLPNERQTAT
jgi:transposase